MKLRYRNLKIKTREDVCGNVSEMPNITEELVRRGYSEEDIRKIWGGNVIRVLKKVIETEG